MAVLRPCPAVIVASSSSTSTLGTGRLSSCSPRTLPLGPLSTTLVQMQSLMPSRCHSHAIRAQKGATGQPSVPDPDKDAWKKKVIEELDEMFKGPPKDMPFREEIVKIDELDLRKMTHCDSSFLHIDANSSSMCVLMLVKMAISLASDVMVSAGLRLGTPGEISLATIKQTISVYVSIFVSTIDETYQQKTTKQTFVSFLDALGGVAAISHILVEDALVNLNDNEGSSLSYSPNCDVDRAQHEFQLKLHDLKHKFRTAPSFYAYRNLCSTLYDAIKLTTSFVKDMTSNLKRAVNQVQEGANRAPDDEEPDSPETSSDSVRE